MKHAFIMHIELFHVFNYSLPYKHSQPEIAKLLINKGANPNIQTLKNFQKSNTVLHTALIEYQQNPTENLKLIIEFLIENKTDLSILNEKEESAFYLLCKTDLIKEELLDKIPFRFDIGDTVFHACSAKSSLKTVHKIFDYYVSHLSVLELLLSNYYNQSDFKSY